MPEFGEIKNGKNGNKDMNLLKDTAENGMMQSARNRHTAQPFTESDDTRGCNNTICPPEDEQGTT